MPPVESSGSNANPCAVGPDASTGLIHRCMHAGRSTHTQASTSARAGYVSNPKRTHTRTHARTNQHEASAQLARSRPFLNLERSCQTCLTRQIQVITNRSTCLQLKHAFVSMQKLIKCLNAPILPVPLITTMPHLTYGTECVGFERRFAKKTSEFKVQAPAKPR